MSHSIVILGVYEFLGFIMAEHFLEKGLEVTGIHIEQTEEYDIFLEEKKSLFARNANYTEISYLEWSHSQELTSKTSLIVFPIYDFFLKKTALVFLGQDLLDHLFHTMKKFSDSQLVCLAPIQYKEKSMDQQQKHHDFLTNVYKGYSTCKLIYLPTIFGPWQPIDYFFQQLIRFEIKKDLVPKLHDQEYIHDAIYSEDLIDAIYPLVEIEGNREFVLISETKNKWVSCVEHLQHKCKLNVIEKNSSIKTEDTSIIIVSDKTSIEQGLARQRFHLQQFF